MWQYALRVSLYVAAGALLVKGADSLLKHAHRGIIRKRARAAHARVAACGK